MAFDRSPIETEIIAVAQPTGNRPDKGRPYLRKNRAGNRRQNKPFVGPRGQQFPSSSTRFQETVGPLGLSACFAIVPDQGL